MAWKWEYPEPDTGKTLNYEEFVEKYGSDVNKCIEADNANGKTLIEALKNGEEIENIEELLEIMLEDNLVKYTFMSNYTDLEKRYESGLLLVFDEKEDVCFGINCDHSPWNGYTIDKGEKFHKMKKITRTIEEWEIDGD